MMKRALIVEDLPDIRIWLGQVALAAFPQLQIISAARRDEAVACVREHSFDLALIDLGLPDGSGVDVVAALHRNQPQALPVVVTIYDDDDHLFPALQAGAFGYLLKEQPKDILVAQLLRMAQRPCPALPGWSHRCSVWFCWPRSSRRWLRAY